MPHGCTVITSSTSFIFIFVFIFIASLHVNVRVYRFASRLCEVVDLGCLWSVRVVSFCSLSGVGDAIVF